MSARFEKEEDLLADVEIDEVFSFMGDERAKVLSNETMPSGRIVFITFFLDELGDVFLR